MARFPHTENPGLLLPWAPDWSPLGGRSLRIRSWNPWPGPGKPRLGPLDRSGRWHLRGGSGGGQANLVEAAGQHRRCNVALAISEGIQLGGTSDHRRHGQQRRHPIPSSPNTPWAASNPPTPRTPPTGDGRNPDTNGDDRPRTTVQAVQACGSRPVARSVTRTEWRTSGVLTSFLSKWSCALR